MWVRSLGWEDPLGEEMVTHSNILAWRIPWTEEPGRLQSMGSQRVGQDWAHTCRKSKIEYWKSEFSSFQFSSFAQSCLSATPWTAALQASLSITNSQSLLKLMSIESVIPSNHLILCHPLLTPPSVFPSVRVFSSGHVWMWEFCEESWTPKNWCFWTVVLEKTLECPLDCKEIQPVHPKGNQSWIFIGYMLKLKLQYFGHLMWRTYSFEKTLMLGKIEGDNRGWDGWMASLIQWTWV